MITPIISDDNKYRAKSVIDGQPYWDVVAIAKDLPQIFSVTRTKKNGFPVVKVRKYPGAKLASGEKIWQESYATDAAVKALWNNRISDGEQPELCVNMPCGVLYLSRDLAEYFIQSVASFARNGWMVNVY